MVIRRSISMMIALALLAGCDPAEDVRVQPLPSLESSTPEARAGLPEIAGMWRFTGWELAPGDTGRVAAELPALGGLLLETQRLDSIAGFYLAAGGRMPLVGEVRRDGVVSLAGGGRYLAGRVARDTLWLALTSVVEPGAWPYAGRAAFVRSPVASSFVRVKGATPALAAADSMAFDTAAAARARTFPPTARPGETAAGEPRRRDTPPVSVTPAEPTPAEPTPAEPVQAEPEPAEPEPATPEPEVAAPRRQRPRLLGVPVDSSAHSPTAARAMVRPLSVSTSR